MNHAYLIFPAMASAIALGSTGFITPAEMTITFTGARLITVDNKSSTILADGSYPVTFKKTDTDFAKLPVADVGLDTGRYIGVQICYNTSRTVKSNGDVYSGPDGAAFANGATVYSHGVNATDAGAVNTTATGTISTLANYVIGNGTNNCSSSYFVKVLCLSADGSTGCQATDTKINTTTSPPALNVILDMYDSVGVDSTNGALDNHVPIYPYPTIGDPGAAVHLRATSAGGNVGNLSFIFGSDGGLVYTSLYQTGSNTGFCNMGGANGFVTVTSGPAGAFINAYGPTAVQTVNQTTGQIQFAAGGCGTGTTCTSAGLQTVVNFKKAVGQVSDVNCVGDGPGALGYTYTGTASPSSATGSVTVKRIVDPGNILGGICTTGGGVCGTY